MIFVNEGEFLFFSTNPLHLNVFLAKHFNLINFACSGIIISLLAIHFFYRLMAIQGNQKWLRHFEMPKFFIWIAIFVVFGLEWYLATLFLGDSGDTVCEVGIDGLIKNFDADPSYTVFIGFKYHVTTNDNVTTYCRNSIVLAMILLKIVLISCTIVTYCGYRTWRKIRSKKGTVSRRTLDMQRQFFRALVVQTLIPAFLLYLPLTTMLIAPIFMADLQILDVVIQVAFVSYPILDPIAVLIIVRDYRRAIKGFVDDHFWKPFLGGISLILPWIRNTRAITSPPISTIQQPTIPRFIY